MWSQQPALLLYMSSSRPMMHLHAIRAFEVHAVDYLLKPYDKESDLPRHWFTHARSSEPRQESKSKVSNHCSNPSVVSARWNAFVVKDKRRIFFVPVSHVFWIEATGNYACIHTASDSHLLRETLAHLEEKLARTPLHPSAEIGHRERSARISEIRPMFDGVYDIVLARRNRGHVEPQIRSQVTGAAGILVLATRM